jgi:NPCBM/NEW2 domain
MECQLESSFLAGQEGLVSYASAEMAPRPLPLILLLALLGTGLGRASAQELSDEGILVQVDRASDAHEQGQIDRLLGWSETGPVLRSGPGPADWMRLSFPLAGKPRSRKLEADWVLEYANGLRSAGRPFGGDADRLDWAIGSSGELLLVPIDLLALRAFARTRIPGPPEEQTEDLLVLRTAAGLDRRSGWLEEITKEGIVFSVGDRVETHVWEKVEALRLLEEEPLVPVQGEVIVRLHDGSFLPFLPRTVEPERWRGRMPWGAKLQLPKEWVASVEPASGPFLDLTELPALPAEFESGEVLVWAPRLHQSVSGRGLVVGGQSYSRGIGVRAPTRLSWKVDGPGLLTVEVGVDAEVARHRDPEPLRFAVYLDGELLAERTEVRRELGALSMRVAVPRAGTLELRCTSHGSKLASGRHGNWLAPRYWQLASGS